MVKLINLYRQPPEAVRSGTLTVWRLFREDDFLSNIKYISECLLDAGITIEPHEHADIEEVYYILSGIGKIQLGDETQEVRQGDAIYIPPSTSHTMKNLGSYPLRFITVGSMII